MTVRAKPIRCEDQQGEIPEVCPAGMRDSPGLFNLVIPALQNAREMGS